MQLWSTIFLTAIAGKHRQARLAIQQLPARTPAVDRPRLAAISARALLVMGDQAAARSSLSQAGLDPEAEALRGVMNMSASSIRRRTETSGPGMAADAACELAWLCLQRADRPGAINAIQRALLRCPEHIEARLWVRYLQDPAVVGFGEYLLPAASLGWLSEARIHHRPTGSVLPPACDTALTRLRDAGVPLPQLASTAHHEALPGGDPLVMLEVMLAEAAAIRRMGYPSGPLLRSAWITGQRQPPAVIRQLARVIMDLAIFDPSAAQVGLAAATVMRQRSDCPRLEARYVRLLASLDHPLALSAARAALRRAAEPEDWALIVESIHRLGQRDEARAEAERGLGRGGLSGAAYAVLMSWEGRTG
jgi:hypothetical protein